MSAGRQGVEQPLVDREVQHHLQPVALGAEVVEAFVGRHVRFGQHHGVARAPRQELAHLLQQVEVHLVRDARPLLFDQERHGVEAEARHAELHPEAHDLLDLGAHERVPGVQVGLVLVEPVEVVGAGPLVARPRRLLLTREDDAFFVVLRPLVGPHVPVAEGRLRIAARLLEPGRVDRRVVGDEVDDDADAEGVGVLDEVDEVAERPVPLVHAVEIGDVVAVVAVGRWIERLQPDAGDAQARQVVEPPAQPFEVADAIAVRVLVFLDIQAVNDGVLVPKVVDGHSWSVDECKPLAGPKRDR